MANSLHFFCTLECVSGYLPSDRRLLQLSFMFNLLHLERFIKQQKICLRCVNQVPDDLLHCINLYFLSNGSDNFLRNSRINYISFSSKRFRKRSRYFKSLFWNLPIFGIILLLYFRIQMRFSAFREWKFICTFFPNAEQVFVVYNSRFSDDLKSFSLF